MTRRPVRLLSVGSIVADVRIAVPSLPARGGDVLGLPASIAAGGGFNILAAAARNGLPAAFAGQHGTGPFGTRIRADLRAEGIAILNPPVQAGDSGFCVVMVEPDGERTFVTSPGVEAEASAVPLRELGRCDDAAVFVSGYDLCYPDLGRAIAAWVPAIGPGSWLTVDPGPLVAQIPGDILDTMLAHAAVWTMNRREACLLTGTDDIARALDLVLPRLPEAAILIVRDGPAGCILAGRTLPGGPVTVPAPAVRMVDSTGAGDAHTGVFLASLARGLDPVAAAARANAAAAMAVTRIGPATAPTEAALTSFLTAPPVPRVHQTHSPSPGKIPA